LTIGRKPDNDIIIDNLAVSGHHAKIARVGNIYTIEDLNSTNGTLLNGQKITKAEIHNKDIIGIAKHSLVLIIEEEKPVYRPFSQQHIGGGETVMIDTSKQAELFRQEAAMPSKREKVGVLHVVSGAAKIEEEYELGGFLTYIGKGKQTTIKIRGFFAPNIAAVVSRRPTGEYLLQAVKPGYPKINAQPLSREITLHDGDLITCGRTKIVFSIKTK
jgi:pSer/pThr/pTyr-binding forkhead associated (FHA) protein